MVSCKYTMFFLTLVYVRSHEMRQSYGSLWQICLALSPAISYSVVDLFSFFSFIKVDIVYDFNYELHSLL